MNNSFCSDFSGNFFADFLAGLIVAVIAGLWLNFWVGKRLSELAGSEQRKAEKRARLERAIRYLAILKRETDDLVGQLPNWIRESESTGWRKEFWIPTPHWDILRPAGELPRLLHADLVGLLSLFYDHLLCAKEGKHWLVTSWLVPRDGLAAIMPSKGEAFERMTLSGLKRALELGGDLRGKLDSEIQSLKAELQKR